MIPIWESSKELTTHSLTSLTRALNKVSLSWPPSTLELWVGYLFSLSLTLFLSLPQSRLFPSLSLSPLLLFLSLISCSASWIWGREKSKKERGRWRRWGSKNRTDDCSTLLAQAHLSSSYFSLLVNGVMLLGVRWDVHLVGVEAIFNLEVEASPPLLLFSTLLPPPHFK